MTPKSKLILPSLAAAWLGFVSPAFATQTDTYGMHAVPVPGKVSIDGDLADWDLSGQTLMCYDVESLQDVYSAKVEQLAKVEEAEYRVFNEFLTKMRGSSEGNESLLDRTMVFHGSNLGNASAHTSQNLPIIVAGGGFKHAGHVLYDRQRNRPLSNLYVRMLHQMGIKADKFGTSTGALTDIG